MDDLSTRAQRIRALAARCQGAAVIVGVAPETLVWAAWVSAALDLPMAYVRIPKTYGRQRRVEGAATSGHVIALIIDGHDADALIPLLGAARVSVVDVGE